MTTKQELESGGVNEAELRAWRSDRSGVLEQRPDVRVTHASEHAGRKLV